LLGEVLNLDHQSLLSMETGLLTAAGEAVPNPAS
jgi:hypothetical protein